METHWFFWWVESQARCLHRVERADSSDGKDEYECDHRAVAKFNRIRHLMEQQFPKQEPTADEQKALLKSILADAAVDETLRRPPKKRSTARSSRTFGG